MNPVVRNFLRVIRRYKLAVALNVLGLSVAFAAFMVIMFQLNYDLGFDKSHKDYDKIFRVERTYNNSPYMVVSRPLAERFKTNKSKPTMNT
jgi:putative ABC transport system permease protein